MPPSPPLQLILAAENNRKRYKLQGEMRVGREASCHIILQSVNISRQHALIIITEDSASIQDLNSANGTYVNGLKIQGIAPLHLGDLVCFDDQPFRIIAEDIPEALLKQVRTMTAEQLAISTPPSPIVAATPEAFTKATDTPSEDPTTHHTRALTFSEMKDILKQSESLSTPQEEDGLPELHHLNGSTAGKIIRLQGLALDTRWKIGNDLSSKICLRDSQLQPDHGYLARNINGYRLTLSSQAPPFLLNGKKLRDAYLQQGDIIQLGEVRWVFYTQPPTPKDPASPPQALQPTLMGATDANAPWSAIITALFIVGVLGAVYILQP